MGGSAITINEVLQWVLALCAFLGGWFLKELFARISKLEDADRELAKTVGELRIDLPTHYVNKADFQQMGDSIFAALRRIEDKLDGKADKE